MFVVVVVVVAVIRHVLELSVFVPPDPLRVPLRPPGRRPLQHVLLRQVLPRREEGAGSCRLDILKQVIYCKELPHRTFQ